MTGAQKPTVSVIVPVFNGEQFLGEALASAWAQSLAPLEVIVVDDGSTDGSAAIASRMNVRYISQANSGVSSARNAGLRVAQGQFVAFLDADDTWLPTKLERQVAALLDAEDAGYALCRHIATFEPVGEPPQWYRGRADGVSEPSFTPSAWLVRRSTMSAVGDFDESLRIGEDTDWLLRARDAGVGVVVVPEALLRRRIHTANLTGSREALDELFKMLRRSTHRKQHRVVNETTSGR